MLIKVSTCDAAPASLIPFPSQNNGLFEYVNCSSTSLILKSNSDSLRISKGFNLEILLVLSKVFIFADWISIGMSIQQGPGLPLVQIDRAFSKMFIVSLGSKTLSVCLVTFSTMCKLSYP